jgi:GNAT superfamily N-acetyltransferase
MEIEIREAAVDDLAFIESAIPRLFKHKPAWRSAQELIDGTVRVLREAVTAERPGEFVAVALAGGERAGFAYAVTVADFFTEQPHAHLSEIVSTREGIGVGRALLAEVERWAFARGSRYVSLNVLAGNDRASKFYAASGYAAETRTMIKVKPGQLVARPPSTS